jgi:hypothetical protein
MGMGFALIAEAGARRFGNFFCHCENSSLCYKAIQKAVNYIELPPIRQ